MTELNCTNRFMKSLGDFLGDSEAQGRLACCSPWGRKELDMTEQLTLSLSVQFSRSVVSDSLQSHGQSMEFSRQEYWSGLTFSSPGDLPNTRIEPGSPTLQADTLPSEPFSHCLTIMLPSNDA